MVTKQQSNLDIRALSRDEVRGVDARAIHEYGIPGVVLMENAGRGATELLIQLGINGPVYICAGKGNNGGDGFVIARHLDLHGIDVRVLLFCNPAELSGDAALNYRVLSAAHLGGDWKAASLTASQLDQELAAADWIVDALLGTGTRGEIREPYVTAINAINRAGQAGRKVFAVDLPSGLDCDNGKPLGPCVRAHHTATFVARKIGFDVTGAEQLAGTVHVIHIGIPRRLLDEINAS